MLTCPCQGSSGLRCSVRPSIRSGFRSFTSPMHGRAESNQSVAGVVRERNWQRSVNPLLLLVVIASCHAKAWTFSQSGASRSQPSHADACGCGPSVHGRSRTAVGSSRPPLKEAAAATERQREKSHDTGRAGLPIPTTRFLPRPSPSHSHTSLLSPGPCPSHQTPGLARTYPQQSPHLGFLLYLCVGVPAGGWRSGRPCCGRPRWRWYC